MATVDGITAAKALLIENASVVSGHIDVVTGHLYLRQHDGTEIDAGIVVDLAHPADTSTHGIASQIVGTLEGQSLSNKTLITPIIASFVNAQHSHANAAGGGVVNVFSGFRGERTATQGFMHNSTSLVNFTAAAVYDTDSYRTSYNTFTIPVSGMYDIETQIPWEGNNTGRRSVDIRKNDTSTDGTAGKSLNKRVDTPGVTVPFFQSVSVLAEPLEQGEYISVFALQTNDASGSLNILGNTNGRTLFTIKRVG